MLIATCLGLPALAAKDDPAARIKEATAAIESGELTQSELVEFYLMRAWAWSDQGEPNQSIQDFSKALEYDPHNTEARKGRGWAHGELEDYKAAIEDFSRAATVKPDDPEAYEGRAWSLEKQGQYDPALADYNTAIQLNPKSAEAVEGRGWIWSAKSDHEKAIADFTKAIELKPGLVTAYEGRGESYKKTGRYKQALADYTEALALKPDNYDAYIARSYIQESLGHLEEAAADAEQAAKLDPDSTEAGLRARELQAELDKKGSEVVASTTASSVFSDVPPLGAEKRIALVIGNGEYAKFPPLTNPVNDAVDMAVNLEETGFTVRRCLNGGRREMLDTVRQFGEDLKQGGVGLFFYAGHGVQVKGENFLIPVDADIRSQDEVEDSAIKASAVLRKMETAGNRLNIIILDACRNNPLPGAYRGVDQGLARMDAPRGSLLVYSTAPGDVASDGAGRNGLFTAMLLKHLKTPGLPVESMLKKVRVDVIQSSGERQTPWNSSSLTGEFFFMP
jgi:tetratricopeptide (TPR) repeat protein